MEYLSIPIIVVCSYLIGEIYKLIFRNRKDLFRYIPLVTSVLGGLMGILIFYTCPEMLSDSSNVYMALIEGIVSGASATGANQLIKQIFFKKDDK